MQDSIKTLLLVSHSDEERKYYLNQFIEQNGKLNELFFLLKEAHPVNMRFAWFLGDIATRHPQLLKPHLVYLFENRASFQILHFNRSLAKFFYYADIPKEIESEVYSQLHVWLLSPKSDISTKTFVLKVLVHFSQNYPELKGELILNLQKILVQNKADSFYRLANKILVSLSGT